MICIRTCTGAHALGGGARRPLRNSHVARYVPGIIVAQDAKGTCTTSAIRNFIRISTQQWQLRFMLLTTYDGEGRLQHHGSGMLLLRTRQVAH